MELSNCKCLARVEVLGWVWRPVALARRAEAETQAAFWKTKAETLEQLIADPKATPGEIRKAEAAVVDAADARRQALDEQILAAAQRYDEQEISLREFKKAESEAQKELAKIDRDTLLQEIAKTDKSAKGMDLFSEQLIDMLEERHPYSKIITQDHQWDLLAKEAVRQLEGEGVTLGQDPRSQMVVRTRIAKLTDVYGPIWHPEAKVATAAKPQSQPSARQPGPSPQALDRDKKLTLASKFPPNTRDIGSAGTAPDMPSEQAIMAMTDDEIAALPKATKARLLNQP